MYLIDGFAPGPHPLTLQALPIFACRRNVRHLFPKPDWDKVRRALARLAGYACESCGMAGDFELHERWEFAIRGKELRQELAGLIVLCGPCHAACHLSLWRAVTQRLSVEVAHVPHELLAAGRGRWQQLHGVDAEADVELLVREERRLEAQVALYGFAPALDTTLFLRARDDRALWRL